MDQSKRNNVILIAALPIMAILVILFVPRADPDDQAPDKGSTVVVEDGEQGKPDPTPSIDTPNGEAL